MDSVLRIHRITKTYRVGVGACRASVTALNDVSFDAARGEVVAIVGAAGSGKSTLLLCAAGLLVPDSGSVQAPPARYVGPDSLELRRATSQQGRGSIGIWLIDDCLRGIAASDYARLEGWIERESQRGAAVLLTSREASCVAPLVHRQLEIHRGRVRPPLPARAIDGAALAARVAEQAP